MTTDPVAELREAARLMREHAAAATSGKWTEMHLGSEGCIVINDGKLRDRKRVATFGWKEWKADHADAVYVASMQPAVAFALADLLETCADQAEQSGLWTPHALSPGPLAIARAYLGRAE